ncbi:hypothetical protein ACK1FJ_003420 [Salmonella enterica]|nr:hypothetical protein [Salmonella enterica subsp. enterica]EEJ8588452.1 hypothetical protein [Salmonella enterica subsp. enterica]
MSELDINWKPEFGTIYTWFAMDKKGHIAMMVNNCFGDLPLCLLKIPNIKSLFDDITDYIWDESEKYKAYSINKHGNTILDLYSHMKFKHMKDRLEVRAWIDARSDSNMRIRECNVPSIKGVFVYYGVEGNKEGDDYPVGYEGNTKMGDYFRYLVPTNYSSIEDFPQELRGGIAKSELIDFNIDRILFNEKINDYFPKTC